MQFKFYKDGVPPQGQARDVALPTEEPRSHAAPGPHLRSSSSSAVLQKPERHDAEGPQRSCRALREAPPGPNVEAQLQELLVGQGAIRRELGQVKMQVNANNGTLEAIRHEDQRRPYREPQRAAWHDRPVPGSAPVPAPFASGRPRGPAGPSLPRSRPASKPLTSRVPQESLMPRNMGYEAAQDPFDLLHIHAIMISGQVASAYHAATAGAKPLMVMPGQSIGCC